MEIRAATSDDLDAINELYNRYVVETHVSFDLAPMSDEARREWFTHYPATGRHRALVAVVDGELAGFATSSRWRPRPAYDTSVETSIYVNDSAKRRGVARALYARLFEELASEDVHRAYAGIALPNDASVAFHESMGFHLAGTLREVGRKFGKWWDVAWYEKDL